HCSSFFVSTLSTLPCLLPLSHLPRILPETWKDHDAATDCGPLGTADWQGCDGVVGEELRDLEPAAGRGDSHSW
ncbi:hypothetical protein, partial [Salmonella enterica]|uniref:hypothetical protein n=1 Tax=Salmonella enterica TaxID=28901 RepID=UPI001BAE7BB7